jgi:putative NADH-flavin reductase
MSIIAIIGGTGYVGSHITTEALSRGHVDEIETAAHHQARFTVAY